MKNILFKLIAAFFLSLSMPGLHAQQAVLSASNNAVGTGGMVGYSVGQVAFITNTGLDGTTSEGVQQPYEILFMEGVDDGLGVTLQCIVYPNPASTFVVLKIENHEMSDLVCQLSDMNGLVLENMKITSVETKIPMDERAPATYLLTLLGNDKTLRTFKIIKK